MTKIELSGITTGLGALSFAKKLRRMDETIRVPVGNQKKDEEKDVKDKD